MIRFVEMECPNCGGSLNKINNEMAKCDHCNAQFLIDNDRPIQMTTIYNRTEGGRNPSNVWIAFAIGLGVLIGIFVVIHNFGDEKPAPKVQQENQIAAKVDESDGLPDSELMQQFIATVFQTEYTSVTSEQLAEFRYMKLYMENGCNVIEYKLGDGVAHRVELAGDLSVILRDLTYFPKLEGLSLEHMGLYDGDLEGLSNLTEIRAANTPAQLASVVEKPEQIKVLGCCNSTTTAQGVEAFVNVETLYLDGYSLQDISAMSALKKLTHLEIEDGDSIKDFGVLASLTNLKSVKLESEVMKDIGFVKNLTNLEEFSLKDSIVMDITPLADATKLETLVLEDNSEITDLSPLGTLENLVSLSLTIGSNQSMPSVENWKNLKSLGIKGVEDISFLSGLTHLEELSITGSNCTANHVLANLTSLKRLKLSGIYGEIQNLNVLNQMPNLQILDISGLELYGNVESVFAIPELEELNLSDCSIGLDFSAMAENSSLKKLNMSRIQILTNISVDYDGVITYVDYDEVSLDTQMGFVTKFANLEELYLQGNKLSNLEFVTNIPKLKKLDITDNYVTDLRPLNQLKELQIVWCEENAISQQMGDGSKVIVIQ